MKITASELNDDDDQFADLFSAAMSEVKCGNDGCSTEAENNIKACWPIPVPDDDSDFPANKCLKFVRSMEVPHLNCELGEFHVQYNDNALEPHI